MFKNTYVQTEHCIFTNANNTCILDLKHWFLYLFFIWLFYYSTPNFKLQEKFLQSKKAHQPKSMHRKMQATICRQTKLYQTGIPLREYHYTSIIYRKHCASELVGICIFTFSQFKSTTNIKLYKKSTMYP